MDGSHMLKDGRANNGLFDGKAFSKINGVIQIFQDSFPLGNKLSGIYYANPQHVNCIERHPILFDGVCFGIPDEWIGVKE